MWTTFLLVLTMTGVFVLLVALPVMSATAIYRLWKTRSFVPLIRPLSIAGGLALGMTVAWLIIVSHYAWPLSFWETFYATVHSDIYGELEDAAEGFVFFMLLLGVVGSIFAGMSGWLIAKFGRSV